jgi:hypothetical protein
LTDTVFGAQNEYQRLVRFQKMDLDDDQETLQNLDEMRRASRWLPDAAEQRQRIADGPPAFARECEITPNDEREHDPGIEIGDEGANAPSRMG